jgi:hypothetical protein
METLDFDTSGMSEEAFAAFSQGVIETLSLLNIDIEYEEFSPDLSRYKVVLTEKEHAQD